VELENDSGCIRMAEVWTLVRRAHKPRPDVPKNARALSAGRLAGRRMT
jgi:hypothetical protein